MVILIKLLSAIYLLSLILEIISAIFLDGMHFGKIFLAGSVDLILLIFILLIFNFYKGDKL